MKNLFKFILFNMMCFMFIGSVGAAYNHDVHLDSLDERCSSDNHCIPICIYKDSQDVESSFIAYYYDSKKWEIGFLRPSNGDKKFLYYYISGNYIPSYEIQWNDDLYDNWEGTPAYFELNENLSCPSYMFHDGQYFDDICFSDNDKSCVSRFGTNTYDFGVIYSSFKKEFDVISDSIYNEEYFDEDIQKQQKEKVQFIFALDDNSSLTYDDSISADDNVKKHCDYFKNEASSSSDSKAYVNKLNNSNYASEYSKNLTDKFEKKVNATYLKNNGIYNYDSLRKLMIYKKGNTDKYRNAYFEKLDAPSFIINNIISAYKYVSSMCEDVNFNMNEEELKKEFKKVYDLKYHDNVVVDLSDDYDCGFLSEVIGLIKTGYFIIELIAVVILIAFSILDYSKVVLGGEADEMKKSNQKFVKRVVIVVVIFLLPAIINMILGIFKIEGINSDNPLCWKEEKTTE